MSRNYLFPINGGVKDLIKSFLTDSNLKDYDNMNIYERMLRNKKTSIILARQTLKIYKLFVRCSVFVLPVHYYVPIPNILEMEKNKHEWARKSELPGIDTDLDRQINNLKNICYNYKDEFLNEKIFKKAISKKLGQGYGMVEGQMLYSFIRHYKPNKIIEVGSGISTFYMLEAIVKNKQEGCISELTCIEPYPFDELKKLDVKIVVDRVQNVPIEKFTALEPGDFLFIDSSHAVKPGSDVNFLILEILPRLKTGVYVHFHDIYFPYDYQQNLLQTFFYHYETSLLRAFLTLNNKSKIIVCMSQIHYEHKNILFEIFNGYNPRKDQNGLCDGIYKPFEDLSDKHFPTSIYIQV